MHSICEKITTFLAFTWIVIAFSGCSKGFIRIVTEPGEATATLIEPNSGETLELGTTPIEAARPDDDAFSADLLIVQVVKEGYRTERFWLPNTLRFNHFSTTDLNIKMVKDVYGKSPEFTRKAWDASIAMLTEAQRLVNQKKYALALAKVFQATDGVGEFPQAMHMIGSIYYLKGEHEKSKKIWKKIIEQNPNDPEAARMLRILEGMPDKKEKKDVGP